MSKEKYPQNELFEKLAEIEHQRWSEGRHSWCSQKCPHCGNDILTRSDVWRHKMKRCTTAGRTLEEINNSLKL